MPIYAFACSACGHSFDRLQKLSDPDPSACPVCGADAVKRQLTAPSFRLSGSGWYETDFKKDGDKKRNLSEKSESASADAGKAESKPDSKGSDAKPSDAKPADSKAADNKAAEGKPAKAETKPPKVDAAPAAKPPSGAT